MDSDEQKIIDLLKSRTTPNFLLAMMLGAVAITPKRLIELFWHYSGSQFTLPEVRSRSYPQRSMSNKKEDNVWRYAFFPSATGKDSYFTIYLRERFRTAKRSGDPTAIIEKRILTIRIGLHGIEDNEIGAEESISQYLDRYDIGRNEFDWEIQTLLADNAERVVKTLIGEQ